MNAIKQMLRTLAAVLTGVVALSTNAQTAPPWNTETYVYDGAGNIKSIGTGEQFRYDVFGRLVTGTAGPGRTQRLEYDRFGNIRTITTDGGPEITFGVDPSTNRVSLMADPDTPQGYNAFATYDAAGRLTEELAGVGNTFSYDGLDMVTRARVEESERVHLYTADDERIAIVSVAANGTEIGSEWTLRGPGNQVLSRFTRSGTQWTWTEDYIHNGSQLLASEVATSERTLHFFPDHLGSPRLITANGGVQTAFHTYYPFGGEATDAAQDEEKLKFTGHERDARSLDYMHARYYALQWGRFLSVDPGKDWDSHQPQSWNMYSYVRNNPTNNTDPDGKWCIPCLAPIVAAAIRVAPEVIRGGQRAYIFLSNPANVQRTINTATSIVGVGITLAEGIYEFPDEQAPGQTYVGQSEDTDRRLDEHERSGKKDPDKDAKVTEVSGGKTAREHAEHNRINELGGKSSTPNSRTSNKVNPIGPKRQPAVEEIYGPIKPPSPKGIPKK